MFFHHSLSLFLDNPTNTKMIERIMNMIPRALMIVKAEEGFLPNCVIRPNWVWLLRGVLSLVLSGIYQFYLS